MLDLSFACLSFLSKLKNSRLIKIFDKNDKTDKAVCVFCQKVVQTRSENFDENDKNDTAVCHFCQNYRTPNSSKTLTKMTKMTKMTKLCVFFVRFKMLQTHQKTLTKMTKKTKLFVFFVRFKVLQTHEKTLTKMPKLLLVFELSGKSWY